MSRQTWTLRHLYRLLNTSRVTENAGFVLPIAVGMGLLIILLGLTSLIRAQDDQKSATAQQATNQSLSITETGVTRTQALLSRLPELVTQDQLSWPTVYNNYKESLPCRMDAGRDEDAQLISGNWVPVTIRENDVDFAEFRLKSYAYKGDKSSLEIEGRVKPQRQSTANETATPEVGTSTTALAVELQVQQQGMGMAHLWVNEISAGNNQFEGNVWLNACTVNGILSSNLKQPTSGDTEYKITPNPSINFPDVPTIPENAKEIAPITGGGNDVLILPDDISNASDARDDNGRYYFVVRKNGSGDSINLSGTRQITIKEDKKVTLFLEGNVDMGGTVKVNHDDNPFNFQVYGGPGTTSVKLRGNSKTNMFLFAPEATVGVSGGGTAPPTVVGYVWAKKWSGSNASQLMVQAPPPDDNIDLPPEILSKFYRVGSVRSWKRTEAQK